jgi:4-amino-4-deoxy-L-arabinose transferase-like glycosyltransferase
MDRKLPIDRNFRLGLPHYETWADVAWTAGLLIGAVVLFTVNLDSLALRDWDEAIVAQIAREIARSPFESLTWLHPTELTGQPYLNKPPLMHWLVAIAYRFGGIHEWTSRLPGALLTACSVPMLYQIGREIFFQRTAAVFSALVYLTWLPVVRNGRLAMLDGAVLCFLTVMVFCLLRSRRDLRWGLGVGISFGCICLTKGILGFLLGAIGLAFIAWDTPRLLVSGYLWGGLALGFAPVAAWYGAQLYKYKELFLNTHLLDQSLKRVSEKVGNNHGDPFFYGFEVLKYGVPWVLFLPQGFRNAWENRNLGWAKLVLLWSGIYFAVISIMRTKLPWYVLPVYPAFALAVGSQLNRWWSPWIAGLREYQTIARSRVWVAIFLVLAIAAWTLSALYTFNARPQPDVQLIFSTLALTLMVTAILIARHDTQFISVLLWGMYLTMFVFVSSNNWVWELEEAYPVKPVAAMVKHGTSPGQVIYTSYPYNRPSLNFYSERPVIPGSKEELMKHWSQDLRPYLLVELKWLRHMPRQTQVVGMSEGWVLVTRNNSPYFQPFMTAINKGKF